jgi:hypothetical protein
VTSKKAAPWLAAFAVVMAIGSAATKARAGAEVKLDRDFLSGLVEKLPPAPFKKDGQYHGSARNFRLVAIDPKGRRFLVACEVGGKFRPPVATALRLPDRSSQPQAKGTEAETPGWRSFTFDVKAAVHVEPGPDGTPTFAVDVEEVKRRELDGAAGLLAKVLGKLFDDIVTKVADGKAATMSAKLNAKMLKQVEAFKQYGVFCEIDYSPDAVVLRFDVTRLKAEGVAGHVFGAPAPGTTPLFRFARPAFGDRYYTTDPQPQGLPGYVYEGIACHVLGAPAPGSIPLERWRRPRECFYVTPPADARALGRMGYHFETVACHVYPEAKPGTVPFYRFVDPKNGVHFYTTHPHAEFLK